MESKTAVKALAALAQETRLAVFRALVEAGPAGLAAGVIGERLGVAPATLSFHLKELANAGLADSRQEGRFVYYTANFAGMTALMGYLTDNCCQGDPAACGVGCAPAPARKPAIRHSARTSHEALPRARRRR